MSFFPLAFHLGLDPAREVAKTMLHVGDHRKVHQFNGQLSLYLPYFQWQFDGGFCPCGGLERLQHYPKVRCPAPVTLLRHAHKLVHAGDLPGDPRSSGKRPLSLQPADPVPSFFFPLSLMESKRTLMDSIQQFEPP